MQNFAKFSDRLINERRNVGLTQEQLAKESDVSLRTIAGYELNPGKRGPAMDIIKKLARALNVTPAWLLGEDAPKRVDPNKSDTVAALRDDVVEYAAKMMRLPERQQQLAKSVIDEMSAATTNYGPAAKAHEVVEGAIDDMQCKREAAAGGGVESAPVPRIRPKKKR